MGEIDNIINYVMDNPDNTNPNILRGMLWGDMSPLPSVTTADNGKVLTVVNGEWDKAETPNNSISLNKLILGDIQYVTPEQFGAKGDGITDDTAAIQNAINT